MNARHKLNKSYIHGALLIAGVIGIGAESWNAFLIFAVIFIGLSVYAGGIRATPTKGR